jgi:archaellum component FlaC
MKSRLENKEKEIGNLHAQIEKLNKTIKDLNQSHKN